MGTFVRHIKFPFCSVCRSAFHLMPLIVSMMSALIGVSCNYFKGNGNEYVERIFFCMCEMVGILTLHSGYVLMLVSHSHGKHTHAHAHAHAPAHAHTHTEQSNTTCIVCPAELVLCTAANHNGRITVAPEYACHSE